MQFSDTMSPMVASPGVNSPMRVNLLDVILTFHMAISYESVFTDFVTESMGYL